MKKFLNDTLMLVALLAMGITFTACGDDDNNNSGSITNEGINLNGTWYLQYYVFENTGNRYECTWGEYLFFNNGALWRSKAMRLLLRTKNL
jgi:hypothetical protein